jgi:hypothetical protein
MRTGVRLYYIATLVLTVCDFTVGGADAQEPLRWKFESGQKLRYNMVQDMTISVSGGPFNGQNAKIHHEMNMTWDIIEATEDSAAIRQKFDRLLTKIESPEGTVEYDTASDEPPVGQAAALAPLYKALTDTRVEFTITPRGEVNNVKIPEKVLETLKNSPNAAALGDWTTPEAFKRTISLSTLVLPVEAPQMGEETTTKIESNDPSGGKRIVEATYRYEGTKQVDGVTCAVFLSTMKTTFEGDNQPTIKEQDSNGEVLFNISDGLLHSSKLARKMEIEEAAGVQTTIDQSITFEAKLAE